MFRRGSRDDGDDHKETCKKNTTTLSQEKGGTEPRPCPTPEGCPARGVSAVRFREAETQAVGPSDEKTFRPRVPLPPGRTPPSSQPQLAGRERERPQPPPGGPTHDATPLTAAAKHPPGACRCRGRRGGVLPTLGRHSRQKRGRGASAARPRRAGHRGAPAVPPQRYAIIPQRWPHDRVLPAVLFEASPPHPPFARNGDPRYRVKTREQSEKRPPVLRSSALLFAVGLWSGSCAGSGGGKAPAVGERGGFWWGGGSGAGG